MQAIDDGAPPGFFGRLRNLFADPQAEWRRIADELPQPSPGAHVLLLACAGAVSGALARLIDLGFSPGASWSWLVVSAGLHVAAALAGVALVAWLANWLAPRFGAERDPARAGQLAGFSATALLAAGAAAFVPLASLLLLVGGAIYSAVLFGFGARVLLPMPEARVAPFTLTVLGGAVAAAALAAAVLNPWLTRGRDALAELTPALSLAPAAPPAENAMRGATQAERVLREAMTVHGPRRPADPARLAEQMPQTLPGSFAMQGPPVLAAAPLASATAIYRAGDAQLEVSVVQLAGLSDVAAAAALFDVPATGGVYTRRERIDRRLFIERIDGASVHYAIIGDGIAVKVEGQGVTVDQARAAVETLGLARLERQFGH